MEGQRIGRIVHYWPRAGAAQVELQNHALRIGDVIRIKGHGHDFVQEVESMEIERRSRPVGRPGEHVAIAVMEPVHEADEVYIVHRGE